MEILTTIQIFQESFIEKTYDMKPLISFCSQCKGRKIHLEQTLLHNLKLIENYDDIDFVLLDFDSPDGLEEWIHTPIFEKYLKNGKLKYFKEENQPYYYQSAVKNLSHHLSTGKNIVNVDADNFLSDEYIKTIHRHFSENKNTVIFISTENPEHEDLFGRIGISRNVFELIHGYDEIFEWWGGEDHDLLRRVEQLRHEMDLTLIKVNSEICGRTIQHEKSMRRQFRTEKTNTLLSPKKISSRYFGKFIK